MVGLQPVRRPPAGLRGRRGEGPVLLLRRASPARSTLETSPPPPSSPRSGRKPCRRSRAAAGRSRFFWVSLRYFNFYRIAIAALFLASALVYADTLNLGSHDLRLFIAARARRTSRWRLRSRWRCKRASAVSIPQPHRPGLHGHRRAVLLMFASGGFRSGLAVMLLISLAAAALVSRGSADAVLCCARVDRGAARAGLLGPRIRESLGDFRAAGDALDRLLRHRADHQSAGAARDHERARRAAARRSTSHNQLRINQLRHPGRAGRRAGRGRATAWCASTTREVSAAARSAGAGTRADRGVLGRACRAAGRAGARAGRSTRHRADAARDRQAGSRAVRRRGCRRTASRDLPGGSVASSRSRRSSSSWLRWGGLPPTSRTRSAIRCRRSPMRASCCSEENRGPARERLRASSGTTPERLDRMVQRCARTDPARSRASRDIRLRRLFSAVPRRVRAEREASPAARSCSRCRRRRWSSSTACTCSRCCGTCCATPGGTRRQRTGSVRLAVRRPGESGRIARDRRRRRRAQKHLQAQLFEPFFTTFSGGTGLGLYIARELCAANGAILDYVDRGTRRGFPDPWQGVRRHEPAGTPASSEGHGARGRRRSRHPRTAGADPGPHGPRGRVRRIGRRGDRLLSSASSFDLCLTDMRLPDGDGLELVRYIGAHCRRPAGRGDHRVSAAPRTPSRRSRRARSTIVSKPLSLEQLRTLVKSALKLPQQRPRQARDGGASAARRISPPMQQVRAHDRQARPQPGAGLHHRRVRQRQGTCGTADPRAGARAGTSRSCR